MSTRSLFSLLLLLIVFAATFTCRFSISLSTAAQPSSTVTDLPVFNSTLLKLAESDSGEPRRRKEIQDPIECSLDKLTRFRPFLIRSYNIRSPAFHSIFFRFKSLLSDWSSRRDQISPQFVLSDLLLLLGRDKKYSSCAVVNSGILLNAGRGAAIDSHEAVIRLNNARISSFASDVGEKTTISFVNSHNLHFCGRRKDCPCYPYGSTVPLLLRICEPIHFLDFATCNSTSVSLNRASILVTDPRFDLLCGRIVKYYSLQRWTKEHDVFYSSGLQAVVTAAAVCERVSLYGFGKAENAKHQYHRNRKAEFHLHDYEAEYAFYRDLMERPYLIPFLPSGFQVPHLQIYH